MPYTPEQFNTNQGQINFLLVDVENRVIWTLNEILRVLKTLPHLKDVDLAPLIKALQEAESSRRRVADITPPGCVAPPPPPLPPPPGGRDQELY